MCGIAGKLIFAPDGRVASSEIEAMLEPIRHRGPDGQGVHTDRNIGLGHRRLSIIDLTGGAQPMTNEDETVWVSFNGEIYNFAPLREKLTARGHTFRTHSDTEVIVHLYEEHGTDFLQHLDGMFSIALWDASCRRLLLARDRVGIKPLYYSVAKGALYFGSEIKSLLAAPSVSRELNPVAIRNFLSFYYLPGEATLFRHIDKLQPGHALICEHGRRSIIRYWDLQFTKERHHHSFEDVICELHDLIGTTVRSHLIADVPVGVLLSGGVDSSALLSFAVRAAVHKIKTFTVGFEDDGVVDERPYARLAASHFGTEHHELTITSDDFWNFLPDYSWHMEEPVCEPPAIALHYVTQRARKDVKVLLSGEGGDEAFAGYPNYGHLLRLDRINRLLGPFSKPAGACVALAGKWLSVERARRYGQALGQPLYSHYYSRSSSPSTYFNQVNGEFFAGGNIGWEPRANPAATMEEILRPVKDEGLLNQMLYADTKTWLPDDILIKADKMTMANSVELRVPLLDHHVLEFAASIPPHYKNSGKESKRALKAAFAKVLPPEIINRRKVGFPVPYDSWLRGPLAGRVREVLLARRTVERGYFNRGAVERLLQSHVRHGGFAKEVFSLLALEYWHRAFVDTNIAANEAHADLISVPASPATAATSAT